jgi:magnesium transporter
MLYFNETTNRVELEQISIVLGKDFLISFQKTHRATFSILFARELKITTSKLRQRGPDYLCYSMLDMIVDNYFIVMEKLGECIESLEEEVIKGTTVRSLAEINQIRKDLIILKKNVAPVRELINNFIRTESDLVDERVLKYFKDVYDHIVQAYEVTEKLPRYDDKHAGLIHQ